MIIESRIDPEFIAFQEGLKPAIRIALDPCETKKINPHFVNYCVVSKEAIIRGKKQIIYYISRSYKYSRKLMQAEAPSLSKSLLITKRVKRLSLEETGLLLGYPICCVKAFAERSEIIKFKLRMKVFSKNSYDYELIKMAACDRPSWYINNLLRTYVRPIISFEPCSYDCSYAIDYAKRIFDIIKGKYPVKGLSLKEVLKSTMLVKRDGSKIAFKTVDNNLYVPFCDSKMGPILNGIFLKRESLSGNDGLLLEFS